MRITINQQALFLPYCTCKLFSTCDWEAIVMFVSITQKNNVDTINLIVHNILTEMIYRIMMDKSLSSNNLFIFIDQNLLFNR